MQTRQKPRKELNVPGRFFTGLGVRVDVTLSDISEGGCRFPVGSQKLTIGSPVQIYIAGSGPHRASIRWVENGEAGVTFVEPLDEDMIERLERGDLPAAIEESEPADIEETKDAPPRRFC